MMLTRAAVRTAAGFLTRPTFILSDLRLRSICECFEQKPFRQHKKVIIRKNGISGGKEIMPRGVVANLNADTLTDNLTREYFANFVRFYADSYAVQSNGKGRGWRTKHKFFSDILLRAHLNQTYAVAAAAPFSPIFYYLDFDFGSNEKGGIDSQRVIEATERLNLTGGQYSLMTSPRFAANGNCHLTFKLEENGTPLPIRTGYRLLRARVGDLCEVYPQPNKKFRLPLGFGQFLIEDNLILRNLSWQGALHFLLKNEAVEVRDLPDYQDLPPASSGQANISKGRHPRDADCEQLLEIGLSRFNTRFESQWLLVCYFRRRGHSREQTLAKILKWLAYHHRGFSAAINQSDWKTVTRELERQIKSAYQNSKDSKLLKPASKSDDKKIGFTEYDLEWIAGVFPRNIVRQKQLALLLAYSRANYRNRFEWIYIPYQAWYRIAGALGYKTFIEELENLGVIEPDWHYRHVEDCPEQSYPRKFKIAFPAERGIVIFQGNAPAVNYLDALLTHFSGDVARAAAFTKIARQRFYEQLNRTQAE